MSMSGSTGRGGIRQENLLEIQDAMVPILINEFKGRYYQNSIYDPKNPFYRVDDFRVLGEGTPTSYISVIRTMLPSGEQNEHKFELHHHDQQVCFKDILAFMESNYKVQIRRGRKKWVKEIKQF